jgi:hypothetical protein
MAYGIFNDNKRSEILRRIDCLSANSSRKWGTLDTVQMLNHCSVQLKLALGLIPVEKTEGSVLFRTLAGRIVSIYGPRWPKNLVTPSVMNMAGKTIKEDDINLAKRELTDLILQVNDTVELHSHPFFGKLSRKDWGTMIYKHIDHHLRQFGA